MTNWLRVKKLFPSFSVFSHEGIQFQIGNSFAFEGNGKRQGYCRVRTGHCEEEEAQKVLQERKRQMEDLREEIGRRRSTGFSGSEQNSYNRSIERSKEAIIDCNSNFEEAKKIAEAKRELYLNADSQFKSLLKLKEKQRDRHIEFETKKDEMQLEDIISSRFVFNQSTSH